MTCPSGESCYNEKFLDLLFSYNFDGKFNWPLM